MKHLPLKNFNVEETLLTSSAKEAKDQWTFLLGYRWSLDTCGQGSELNEYGWRPMLKETWKYFGLLDAVKTVKDV